MEAQGQVHPGLPGSCLLLGGQPRSGTTLISSILRATPDHFQAFETHIRKPSFVAGLDGRYTRNIMKELGLPPEEYEAMLAETDTSGMNLGAWTGPKEEVSAEPLTGRETAHFASELVARARLMTRLMNRVAAINGKRSWGFKILGDIMYADVFEQAFPRAVFVLLVRDPRDQALSILQLNEQRRARNQPLFYADYREAAVGWRETITAARAVLKHHRLHVIETRYEDLVMETDREIARLSALLGLDLFAGLRFQDEAFVETHTRRFRHHDNLRNSIHPGSVGKWKERLSEDEQAVFRETAGDVMREFGYL